MPNNSVPENSQFRSWFRNCLGSLPGNTAEWPFLVRQILAEELQKLRTSDQYYAGSVFRNRDDRVHTHRTRDSEDEEILVYKLYSAVHEKHQGILMIGDVPVWLFTLQVPNQGKRLSSLTKGRRADLLGLKPDGSLILFEAKGPRNGQDGPLYGILEGLDYLGCLLTSRNLSQLNEGLQEWIIDHELKVKDAQRFSSSIPDWPKFIDPSGRHSVVVLAPRSYFDLHLTDVHGRPQDWWLLSDHSCGIAESNPQISLGYSVADFDQGTATWFEPPVVQPQPSRGVDDTLISEAEIRFPRNLIWTYHGNDTPVTKVRYGRKNSRIKLSNGDTLVVPNTQLRPDGPLPPVSSGVASDCPSSQ